jgi:Poly A polymerase head domain
MATRILLDNLDQGLGPLASRPSLVTLGQLAAARSLEVYLVGGSVRELALGRSAQDLDLAVSAQTLELAQDLASALGGTYVLLDEAERTPGWCGRGRSWTWPNSGPPPWRGIWPAGILPSMPWQWA